MKASFTLTMPGRGGAVHSSFGKDRNYVIVRQLTEEQVRRLFPNWTTESWVHAWNDGWVARILGRVMERGERTPRSDGFAGYDWMVDNIIAYGQIEKP